MAEPFLPLSVSRLPALSANALSQLPPNFPTGKTAQRFAPLTMAPEKARPAHDSAHLAASAESPPKVTLQRDGERVMQIRIECSCGQIIELDCEY